MTDLDQEIDKEVEADTTHENTAPTEKEVADKPISTREAITNALKEAKEKDETKTSPQAKDGKPVRAAKERKPTEATTDEPVQAVTETPKPVEGPKSWPSNMRGEFAKLPASVQKFITDRESEVAQTVGRSAQTAEFGNRVKEIVTPYEAIITAEGGTPEKAIKELMNSAYVLRRGTPQEKARLVIDTMRRFGVDLRLAGNMAQPAAPNINELVQKGVQTEIEKFQQKQELENATREWQTFRDDPAHPHCDLVMDDMRALLNGGRAQGFQDAYEKAVWAHPELRSTLIDQTTEQRNTKIKQENEARRRAGSSLSGAPGKSSAPVTQQKQGKNTREDIMNAMAQVRNGENF